VKNVSDYDRGKTGKLLYSGITEMNGRDTQGLTSKPIENQAQVFKKLEKR
jgi:hypothetical protein